jgi:pSer/pThr/pTyr-binding forkhead associated (FHA) protein
MSYVYCGQCGFQNPETANYCARCGALLSRDEPSDVTMSFTPAQEEDAAAAPDEIRVQGPALVVRSGGGLVGETFVPERDRTLIGRSPECDVFLDDVTVSRKHAVLVREGREFTIEDQGSLNGTFVNRARIESARLEDGDELQIGKYRLTFMNR